MPDPLSPLRRQLCSHAHAVRVAVRRRENGETVAVVATRDPMQPWRVVDVADALPEVALCA